jgi:saccharopine dehydrogenase (NAD+, L-lysine-forming)
VDLCLVAAPTTQHSATVIYACLAAGADYLDIQFAAEKLKALFAAREKIEEAGRCFITEAGYHPGLPAAMVRYAASKLDSLESAVIAGYLNMGGSLPYTEAVDELMEAFIHYEAQVYKNGAWTKPSQWAMLKFDFGADIGPRTCYSMFFEELRDIPKIYPTLKETGFYISGSNWIADLLVTPIVMLGLKIAPKRGLRPLGKLMWWAMQQSKPPYQVMIAVEAMGLKNGIQSKVRASVSHPDGYELTAIPVVAYLKQYLDGSARKPGLHMMGQLAEPARLFADMQAMGARISVE